MNRIFLTCTGFIWIPQGPLYRSGRLVLIWIPRCSDYLLV